MKNDVSKGNGNHQPEKASIEQREGFNAPGKHNIFLSGIARIIQAMKPKRFISYRKKKINKDGSCVETEFIYRDDS